MSTAPDGDPATGRPATVRFPLLARAWPLLVGLLLAAILASLARRPFRAFDTYFHLRFGEEFRHGWSIAHPGQPSAASSNDWAPTQWLAQVGLSWLDDTFGVTGLVVCFAVLVAALAASGYWLLRQRTGPGTAVVLTTVVIVGSLPSLSLRPQLLSYLLFVAVLASWEWSRRSGRAPWWLLPLVWLWAMSHGMWILGLGASAGLAVAVCLEHRGGNRVVRVLAVPVAMLVVACLTPVGPRLVSSVLLVTARSDHFDEWAVPELISLAAAPVTVLLALAVLCMARRDGVRTYDIALLGLGCVLAIYSQRTLPLALIVLALVVAGEVTAWRDARGRSAARRGPRARELVVVAALALAVVVVGPVLPLRDAPADDVEPFADLLGALPAGTVVLTDRSVGGVLLWTEPQLDVPIHGYGDVYTDAELDAYDDLERLEPGWEETLGTLGASVALLPEDHRLTAALQEHRWTVAETSDDLSYLVAPRS